MALSVALDAPIPAHILPTLEHLETQATSTLNTDLQNFFDRIVQQSDSIVTRKDIQSVLTLNQGLSVALQRPILGLWEAGWLSGSEHAIAEMQDAVPQWMVTQAEQYDLGSDIKRAIRGEVFAEGSFLPQNIRRLFQLTARTFRNLRAERAVQKRALKLAGNFSKNILDGVKADLLAAIMPQPDTGNPIGREELLKRLQGRLGVSKVRARAIAVTEATNAYNQGRLSSFQDSKLVTHLLFLSIHDHRTTDICQSRANMIVPVQDKRAIVLNTPPLHVNALVGETEVKTATGTKEIKDVKPGEYVLTHKGRYKKVYASFRVKPANILRIQFSTGKIICISHEHPVLTPSGYTRADMLKVGDNCFQYFNKPPKLRMPFLSVVPQTVLIDSANRPPIGAKEKIAASILDFATFMASAVDLQGNKILWKGEINNVFTNRELEFVVDLPSIKEVYQQAFVQSGSISVNLGSRNGFLLSNPRQSIGVASLHPFRGIGAMGMKFFPLAMQPMGFPLDGNPMPTCKIKSGLLPLGSDRNIVFSGKSTQASIGQMLLSLNGSKRFTLFNMLRIDDSPCLRQSECHWSSPTIDSIVELQQGECLYNLSVEEDESYLANDVVVSNCRSVISPLLSINARHQKWIEDESRLYSNRKLVPLPKGWKTG
jgi:SPP1 gp7 family putative phage head morphogenesis protein